MSHNPNEVFASGATTSQHIEAQDDDHFENTTFKLKRTRSMGLLDEFIQPLETPAAADSAGAAAGTAVPAQAASQAADDDETATPAFKSPDIVPHDDTDIAIEPSLHVDYLSHQWDVGDISRSWRYIIQKRKDVANSARLENASWRTWAQRRAGLKTINPELLNWSKESDITWLYGPIVKDDENTDSDDEDDHKASTTATSKVAGDISIPNKKNQKGILKQRTVEDQMISHANLLKLQLVQSRLKAKKEEQQALARQQKTHRRQPSNEPPEFDDYDAISQLLNTQYKNSSNPNSSTNLAAQYHSPVVSSGNTTQGTVSTDNVNEQASDGSSLRKETRHIHFNDEVQQCIALEPHSEPDDYDYDDDDDDSYYYDDDKDYNQSYIYTNEADKIASDDGSSEEDDEDDDDDGGFFLKVKSPSSATTPPLVKQKPKSPNNLQSPATQITDDSDSISTTNSRSYTTIQLLPSTSLNYGSDEETSDEENPYTSSMSHNVHNSTSRGYDYMYDYNTVYTVDPSNHIYGSSKNAVETPDVVDVPEDIANFSNYEPADHDDTSMPIIDPTVISGSNMNYNYKDTETPAPFEETHDDLESETDADDEGLSIATRSSSQQLAQQIYNQNSFTPAAPEAHHYPQKGHQPIDNSVSAINPRHSSTGLSKQATSSNSLSDQFFGTTPIKQDASTASLADQFFNHNIQPAEPTKSLSQTQQKARPLPPHTTAANAFAGTQTPPLEPQRKPSSGFVFDSDSDSDDEFVENVSAAHTPSYNSLSQVAGKSGISSPHEGSSPKDKNFVYQAKDLANHFLGNWNAKE